MASVERMYVTLFCYIKLRPGFHMRTTINFTDDIENLFLIPLTNIFHTGSYNRGASKNLNISENTPCH